MADIVRLEGIKTYYELRRGFFSSAFVRAVDGVTLSIGEKEALGVVGESGCGKSTLGKTSIRILRPSSGRVIFEGEDVTDIDEGGLRWLRRRAQPIFQDPYSSINPFMTVSEVVEEPLLVHGLGAPGDRREKVYSALKEVGLTPPEGFARMYPHELSGGQRQRVAIARALVLDPKYIVADEPVSMIDASSRAEVLSVLRSIKARVGLALMYITHDLATAKHVTDRIAVMYLGKVVELGPTRGVLSHPLHPYTRLLIEAIPEPDPRNRFEERPIIPGEPPNPINPPGGCRFHPRCPIAMKRCGVEEPHLIEYLPRHYAACHRAEEMGSLGMEPLKSLPVHSKDFSK